VGISGLLTSGRTQPEYPLFCHAPGPDQLLDSGDVFAHSYPFKICGYSLVVKLQPSKLAMRVRFPLPAPPLIINQWIAVRSSLSTGTGSQKGPSNRPRIAAGMAAEFVDSVKFVRTG